jgi:hypothetical protein
VHAVGSVGNLIGIETEAVTYALEDQLWAVQQLEELYVRTDGPAVLHTADEPDVPWAQRQVEDLFTRADDTAVLQALQETDEPVATSESDSLTVVRR